MTDEKKTVLIVDDEPDIVELISEEFDYCGFATLVARSGNEAVEILKQNSVDSIISDYKMPDGNGMVILEYVMTLEQASRPTFFFVSGQADISATDAVDAGANNFFSKPFDLDELVNEVTNSLK